MADQSPLHGTMVCEVGGRAFKFLISWPFSTYKYDSDTEYLLKKLTGKIVKKKLHSEKFWIKFKLPKEKENSVNFPNNS